MDMNNFLKRKRFWFKDWYTGQGMWKELKEIEFIYNHLKEGERIRNRRLCDILRFASKNVPFYQRRSNFSISLDEYPVVNKQIYLDGNVDFQTPLEKIPGQKGPLHVQRTSGSTGTPFALPQDTRCRVRRIATIKFGNELIGTKSFEPIIHFRALNHHYDFQAGEYIIENKKDNIIYIDNSGFTEERLRKIVETINQKKAKIIRGYSTALDTVSRYVYDNNLELTSHPTFISGGEMMLESMRARVVEELHCNIISQYANEENGVFGQSIINEEGSTIILNRANCFIEILKMDSDEPAAKDELGRIVVTDFTNYAMPMIRYDIGDVACIGEERDGILLSIKNLTGRKSDLIYKTNGEFIDMYNNLPLDINYNQDIRQWQFIQKGASRYEVVLSSDKLTTECIPHFEKELKDILGNDAEIKIVITKDIPVLNSGKRKSIINEWKK